ncbi:MAG TPA: hypothetical protein VHA56_13615 [Mucilaginibacter sp.]|nr:hypothetical protein [Mucilaginibacter sp.]
MKKLIITALLTAFICKTGVLIAQKHDLTATYNRSVKLAMIADSSQNIDTLMAIVPSNSLLQWKTINGQKYVLFGSFTNRQDQFPQGDSTTLKGQIWLFIPGQMHKRLDGKITAKTDTILRLNEMLGLPPVSGYTHIAQFWVHADSIFRPAGNPDVTLTRASGVLSPGVTEKYKLWFNNNIINSYFKPLPPGQVYYPWTRMGYTYDWAPRTNRVGLSEFVMQANSGIWVEKVYKASDYFKK